MGKIRTFFSTHRSEIIVGIVVFVLTSLGNHIVQYLAAITPTVGSSILGTIINTMYSSAAWQTNNSLMRELITCIIAVCIIAVLFTHFFIQFGSSYVESSKLLRADKEIKELEDKIKNKEVSNVDILKYLSDQGEKGKKKADEKYYTKQLKRWSLICICAFTLYLVFLLLFTLIPNHLWEKFERDLVTITPYTETETIVQLRSDWTCMSSKADYDLIYETIQTIKDNNNLPR